MRCKPFFQNEKKFVVGQTYETLRVNRPPYNKDTFIYNLETCDEVGTIISGSELFLGKYVRSWNYGSGDNIGRCDTFMNDKGVEVSCYLDYDGKTRYRQTKTFMDERIPFINLVESIEGKTNKDHVNEHVNKFLFNPVITKEICSFMNPIIK